MSFKKRVLLKRTFSHRMFATVVWKNVNISGFERYEVSSDGEVRNVATKRLLKIARRGQKGLPSVWLTHVNGTNKPFSLGKLILSVFKPRENMTGLFAAHITGDQMNNRVSNLRWQTRSQIAKRTFEKKAAFSKPVDVTIYNDKMVVETKHFNSIQDAHQFINDIFVCKVGSITPLTKSNYRDRGSRKTCVVRFCHENEYYTTVIDLNNEKWEQFFCVSRNRYYVSNHGRVKSVGINTGKERLKSTYLVNGYTYVNVQLGKKVYHFPVHRLVAQAFVPNPHKYEHLDHEDTIRSNNFATNLKWVATHKDNVNNQNTIMKRINHTHIAQIDKQTNNVIQEWENAYTIAKTLGFQSGNILACCRNQTRSAYGFGWQFLP